LIRPRNESARPATKPAGFCDEGDERSLTAILANFCHNRYIAVMATMNISLPDDLKSFVDEQVAGRYSTSSEYVRELIRREQDIQVLRTKLLEGAASPLEGPVDDAYFERLYERIGRRAAE
jgi:antitoxin ParD1/3/4